MADASDIIEVDDWLSAMNEPFRSEFLGVIRGLSLNRLQNYPLPKRGGLPIGREWSVLRRHLRGECAVFEQSAAASLYARLAGTRDRELLRGFVWGDSLSRATWVDLLGLHALERWIENRLLRPDGACFYLPFSVYGVGPLALIADGPRPRLPMRVIAGQDSLNLREFLRSRGLPRVRRHLDVGPGSGIILLEMAGLADEAVGLDINPRAIQISRLNADLNGIANAQLSEADVFQHDGRFGTFDRITWNTPFLLMPPASRESHHDGYGGHMGIEIQANFIRLLPTLLNPDGRALLCGTSTILKTGENLMDAELHRIAPECGLDITIHVLRRLWFHHLRAFHDECGVRHFEFLLYDITRGPGRFRRIEPPPATRALDILRGWLYRMRT